jgi:phosphopantetheinyl transferase (holo-ACP synthase)
MMTDISEKVCVTNSFVSIGVDIALVSDMRDFENGGVGILLTQGEWSSIEGYSDRLRRLAGKFAGKEAVMKALGY